MNRRKGKHRLLLAGVMMVAVVLLAGCQEAAPVEVAEVLPTSTTTPPAGTPQPAAPAATKTRPVVNTATVPVQEIEPPVAPTLTPIPRATESEAAVAAAVADLAQDLGVAQRDVHVQLVEAVDWPDSSLGCPQPGMAYAQFVTPGFRILLEVGGALHEYHTDQKASAVWCGVLDTGARPLEDGKANVQDGWPSQPITGDVILEPPSERKQEP